MKTESKLTTLARLVAVYNSIACGAYDERLEISYRQDRVVLYNLYNKGVAFCGGINNAISYIAKELCSTVSVCSVSVDCVFGNKYEK